jgi:hypothetical protein
MEKSEEDIVKYLESLPENERDKLINDTIDNFSKVKFIPNPGPQSDAYYSKADILLYGGSAGSGKSALITGLALTQHKKSHVFRRKYADLSALAEDLLSMYGSRKGFSQMPRPKLRADGGRLIEFGACQHAGDEEAFQGQQASLKAFDEVTQFLEQQFRYIITWCRSTDPKERCRVIAASNPPTSADGDWVIPYWGPWLDPTHPNKAEPGELRWVVSDPDGKDFWVDGPEPHQFPGTDTPVKPKSRTFIPGKLQDNPYLVRTDYAATLDSLPEPLRSAMRDGNFMLTRSDADFQVIPSEWVRQAQARWKPEPPDDVPQSCISADTAQGGADDNIIGWRHDWWFSKQIVVPGKETPLGTDITGPIITRRQHNSAVVIDVGGGYGGSTFKTLKDNGIKCKGYNGTKATKEKALGSKLKFANHRAKDWWRMREALDPSQMGGSKICLPPDAKLAADLTAPTYSVESRGILIENKKAIKKRLGRSPDKGDQVVMCWSAGDKGTAVGAMYGSVSSKHGATPNAGHNSFPKVNLGYKNRR